MKTNTLCFATVKQSMAAKTLLMHYVLTSLLTKAKSRNIAVIHMQSLSKVNRCIDSKHGILLPTDHKPFEQFQGYIVCCHCLVEVAHPVYMCGCLGWCGGESWVWWSGGTRNLWLGRVEVIIVVTDIAENDLVRQVQASPLELRLNQ